MLKTMNTYSKIILAVWSLLYIVIVYMKITGQFSTTAFICSTIAFAAGIILLLTSLKQSKKELQ